MSCELGGYEVGHGLMYIAPSGSCYPQRILPGNTKMKIFALWDKDCRFARDVWYALWSVSSNALEIDEEDEIPTVGM